MDELFLNRMKELLKDEYDDFIKSLSEPPVKAFYTNNNKENVLDHLDKRYIEKHPLVDNGYYYDYENYPMGKSPFFLNGLYYIQEPSAMLVSQILDVKEDDYVLDMCGAPGGKTCGVASKLSNEGLMITNDISASRAKVLSENVERFGLENTIVIQCDPTVLPEQFVGFFDKIILDAPCSGEGMFRKEKKAIETWSLDKIEECAGIQKKLIEAAYEMLREGGELVYSTCTYALEENEDIINYALEQFDLSLVNIEKSNGMESGIDMPEAVRCYPHKYRGEGQFIAKLKKGHHSDHHRIGYLKPQIGKSSLRLVKDFYEENLNIDVPEYLYENNHHIYAFKPQFPKVRKAKILRNGLYLGECKKNYFVPSFALALTLKKGDVKRSYHFKENSEEIRKYMHGETLEGHGDKGYGVIFVEDYPFSFYKENNHQIKNLFPKGLRR